jgi:hypothetical protein
VNNLEPGLCPRCHNKTKPLFTSHYCDCDEVTEKIKKVETDDDKDDYNPNHYLLPSNYSTNLGISHVSSQRKFVRIKGIEMTHWWECDHCHQEAFYFDRDPSTIVMNSRYVSRLDGLFQINHLIFDHQNPLCDSCRLPLSGRNFSLDHLHKY